MVPIDGSLLQLFATAPNSCAGGFFGLIPWYAYLPTNDFQGCAVINFDIFNDTRFILLAVVDDALRVAGLVAIGYVIYGGFQYVTSQGEPDKTRGAKNTITNALVGLVIAGVAIAIVGYIGSQVVGG